MAGCDNIELRRVRESKNYSREKLGNCMGVSADTIRRWEYGESKPEPDDVDRMGEILEDSTLWHRWMLSNVESYAKRYVGAESLALPVSIMRVRHALGEVMAYQDRVERDSLDGKLDDQQTAAAYGDCLRAAIAKLSEAAQHMTGGETRGY